MSVVSASGLRAIVLSLAVVVLVGGIIMMGGRAAGAGGESTPTVIGEPTPTVTTDSASIDECMNEGHLNCNPDPSVLQHQMQDNPITQPPGPHARLLSEQAAIEMARKGHPGAETFARLMTRAELEALGMGNNLVANQERLIWVVTVHADVYTPANIVFGSKLVHAYTLVIDAETGQITDACTGCDTIKEDSPGTHVQ